MNITDIPYIVSLHKNNNFVCGGSFIHKNWILTAAHCYPGTKNVTIRAGSSHSNSDGIVIPVEEFIRHPDFKRRAYLYNFALIKVNDWNDEGIVYEAVPLPPANGLYIPVGSLMLVAGYGKTEFGSTTSLMGVYVHKWNQRKCRKDYYVPITYQMLCASDVLGGKDSCQGDSGGPLIFEGVLVGVVSIVRCSLGYHGYPSVYSRVSSVRNWIQEISGV